MHVFEELASRQALLCPDTGKPLEVRAGHIVSASGRDFGAVTGPLNFLRARRESIDPSTVLPGDVERMRTQLDLPATPEMDAQIARAIAASGALFSEAHLSAEARILAERFRMPAFEIGTGRRHASWRARLHSALRRLLATLAPTVHRLERLSDSIGERLTANEAVFRSVRVRNAGDALACAGAHAARIETRWSTAEGVAIPESTVATPLPVDIGSGREITLILRVRAPSQTGPNVLTVSLVPATGAPIAFVQVPVEVVASELPTFEYVHSPTTLEYSFDHHIAMEEAKAFLAERYGERRVSILEIGGGVHPSTHSLALGGHRVVSCDVSHSQSILGTLFFRHKMPNLDESLAFMSCEGTALPLAPAAFDGVALIAAFHHFADPVSLLQELKRVTRPDGFIYIACDNCVPDPSEAEYLEELRRGINEQMWTLAEYAAFFRGAGLRVSRARVDGTSLKAVLVKD